MIGQFKIERSIEKILALGTIGIKKAIFRYYTYEKFRVNGLDFI
ncbi:hypothetical protein [Methanolobus sp. ZRKC5]